MSITTKPSTDRANATRGALLRAALVAPVLALAMPLAASAGEVSGVVAQVDADARTLILETGEAFTLAEGIVVEEIVPGTQVVVTYTDGTTEATEIVPAS